MKKYTKQFCLSKFNNKILRKFFAKSCSKWFRIFNCATCGNGGSSSTQGSTPTFNWTAVQGGLEFEITGAPFFTSFDFDRWVTDVAPYEEPPATPTISTLVESVHLGVYSTKTVLGIVDSTGGTSPTLHPENEYIRYTIQAPISGDIHKIWFFIHEEGVGEGEPALEHQISFDDGATWQQADGLSGSIVFPYSIL